MTRFGTKLAAVLAAFTMVAAPGIAAAQDVTATTPVAFANLAAIQVTHPNDKGELVTTSYAAETLVSPADPGTSTPATVRAVFPSTDDPPSDVASIGGKYEVNLGTFDSVKNSPYPDGVASLEHKVVAQLDATHVPSASVEGNFALRDFNRGGGTALDNTVFAFQGAKTSVDCSAVDNTTATVTADKFWVLDPDTNQLVSTDVPTAGKPFTKDGLKFGASMDTFPGVQIDPDKTTSKLTISPLTDFAALIRQTEWHSGDVNAVAGWQADIVTHYVKKTDSTTLDIPSKLVLGGVSCSLPKDFTPVTPAGDIVPTAIPAGPLTRGGTGGFSSFGLGLIGAGVLLGGGVVFLLRRRQGKPE